MIAIAVTALQLALLALHWPTGFRGLPLLIVALASLWAARRERSGPADHGRFLLPSLLAAQLVAVEWAIPPGLVAGPERGLRLVAILGTLLVLLVQLLDRGLRMPLSRAVGIAAALVGVLVIGELVATLQATTVLSHDRAMALESAMVPDSMHGRLPADTLIREFARENPRGYLKAIDVRERLWQLSVAEGNEAVLELPPSEPGRIRVAMTRADTGPGWHIQLSQPRFHVQRYVGYTVTFRYRASADRQIGVGFMQAHPPFSVLGFYRAIAASPGWQDFTARFEATLADTNARIAFDLGGNPQGVELDDVVVHDDEGNVVEPDLGPDRFYVDYHLDGLGCRTTQPGMPGPSTGGVLVLGGASAFGVGVHDGDTFASLLTVAGDTGGGAVAGSFPVANCASPGSGVREQVQRYDQLAPLLRPRLVLVVIGAAVADGEPPAPAPTFGYARVFRLLGSFTALAARAPSPTVVNLRALDTRVRDAGGRFAVVLFRASPDPRWSRWKAEWLPGLVESGIPVLDLGHALADSLPWEQLLTGEVGSHPNEVAHRIAASEMRHWLDTLDLLPTP